MSSAPYVVLDDVQTVLEDDGWTVARTDDRSQIFFRVASNDGSWNVLITATGDLRLVVISFVMTVPERSLGELDWLIGRLNYSMLLGRFEIDESDHEIRFVTSVGVDGVEVTPSLVRELCYPNFANVERYLPSLRRLSEGDEVTEIYASIED